MRAFLVTVSLLSLTAGCGQVSFNNQGDGPVVEAPKEGGGVVRPKARPDGFSARAKPPKSARTVDQFDTTSRAEKKAAVVQAKQAEASGAGARLGLTVVGLGDPADPGIWIKTPLVSKASKGRVTHPGSGKSVAVDMIPLPGPKTGGSRMSLAAMRAINLPLADLTEVEVHQDG